MSGDESPSGLEAYLEQVGQCRGQNFGRRYRDQFRDTRGSAELAMLAAPSEEEYEEFYRAVAVMSAQEKAAPEHLGDAEITEIAKRAGVDVGNVSIFLNGYVLATKATREQDEIDE